MSNKKIFWLSIVLCFTSFHFEKSLRIYGLILYVVVTSLILLSIKNNSKFLLALINKFNAKYLFVVFLLILAIGYSFWYPREDVRSRGTDRDEALNQAVKELTSFRYPYYVHTLVKGRPHDLGYDNNPITLLPRSIFFAIPFVLLGNSTYQNFFWLGALFLFLAYQYRSYGWSFLFIVSNTLLCGTFLFQILIGSDYIANSIWVLIFTVFVINTSQTFTRKSFLLSVLLGLGLASRLNFTIIIIPLAFYIFFATDFLNCAKHILGVFLGFGISVLPFLLYDFKNFTPIHYSNFYSGYDAIVPYSSILFPIAILVITIVIAYFVLQKPDTFYFVVSCAYAFPVLLIVILQSIANQGITFELSHYAFPSYLFLSYIVFKEIKTTAT